MEKTPKNDAGKKASEVVAICDHPNFNVESLIRTIRGQKVMLDFDLSMLYGVQNKRLNEQVKRNKERFPDDFMFQLTQVEWSILRSQFATAKQLDNEKNSNLKSQFATTKDISMSSNRLLIFWVIASKVSSFSLRKSKMSSSSPKSSWHVRPVHLLGMPCERRCRCSRTDNPDSPSGKCGRRLSDNSHRKPCYGLRLDITFWISPLQRYTKPVQKQCIGLDFFW